MHAIAETYYLCVCRLHQSHGGAQTQPTPDDGEGGMLPMAESSSIVPMSFPITEVTVPEVLSKALVEAQDGYKAVLKEAQAVMKKAKDDHSAAVRVISHGCDKYNTNS